jgi:hypothetical protein
LSTLARNVNYATFVLHKCDGTVRNQQREGNTVEVIRLERTALEGFDPRLSDLLSKVRIFDPLNFGPKLLDRGTHGANLPVQTHKLTVSVKARRVGV